MFLACKNLYFNYRSAEQVLRQVVFSLEKGKTLAIVGASGCGKSTLLKLISGILPGKGAEGMRGSLEIDGKTPAEYRKMGKLAFMFQEATLLPHLTVRENIALPLKITGNPDETKVNRLIKSVGLEAYEDYLPKALSGGMKTRVALARSFSTHPELLLLDEPFSALDIAWKSKLYLELERLREEAGTTVIIVTHDVQEALLLADHVIVMNSTGSLEVEIEIRTGYPIMQRLNDISGYMNSIYETYMLPIQDAIITGQRRNNEKQDIVHIV